MRDHRLFTHPVEPNHMDTCGMSARYVVFQRVTNMEELFWTAFGLLQRHCEQSRIWFLHATVILRENLEGNEILQAETVCIAIAVRQEPQAIFSFSAEVFEHWQHIIEKSHVRVTVLDIYTEQMQAKGIVRAAYISEGLLNRLETNLV